MKGENKSNIVEKKKKKYVLDSNSLIKFKDFLFMNYDCYITEGVIKEIKDESSRNKLNNILPLLKISRAEQNDINFIKHFSKLTGDYDSLSEVDIEVIALTYNLHRKFGDVSKLNASPMETIYKYDDVQYDYSNLNSKNNRNNKTDTFEKREDGEVEEKEEVEEDEKKEKDEDEEGEKDEEDEEGDEVTEEEVGEDGEEKNKKIFGIETIKEEVVEVDENKNDDDGGKWINVNNFDVFNLNVDQNKKFESDIACVTTDYAMQNVLYQIGLNVITIDGYQIRSIKLWGYICTSCYFFMRKNSLLFCSKCGNNSLRKVNVIVDNELKKLVVKIPNFKVNYKNTIFSIPKKKNKNKSKNKFEDKLQIFREDELLIGGRKQYLNYQKKLYDSQKNIKYPFKDENMGEYINDWTYRTTLKNGKIAILKNPKIIVGGKRNTHHKRK
ncbi:RNA-binding protein NOB1, putative [Plasmodium berghei]|uniref:RNA-binding protein NOB1, putative n=2 Tax=Plasmodium berghei TaxID=5821 RepID=A0A509AI16_PLABA|nr:RNA-binding protein NOB1, putative [Plasmodium berghei ANKA]CXI27167.1 RNA-binding protein NOB1, putative [Plasmodium berghei]SCM20561.1 RNA-binding protein NOB1, putative [Plasmodium berghei]SCN24144.1 RNA-binding protein NOB1, putative [Plasmodium berghei]SCO59416.1 RNA-binding protein NOB1, putative [Plasmodium berghei]SCO60638.1 RNA-binding protein NOB1, putative [Plasmodium berghei]|eukprot:XP_034420952.1 RNA-binding protein NOB1, putative [Plasmodium berghei ANKA]